MNDEDKATNTLFALALTKLEWLMTERWDALSHEAQEKLAHMYTVMVLFHIAHKGEAS